MSRRSIRTLIVDDSPVASILLRDTLDELDGITVVGVAGDGDEGLQLAEKLQPDVVTLDLRMPRKGGFDALPDLKALTPSPKVIVLTSFPFSSHRRRCEDAGADFFFDKSTELHEAVALLRRWGAAVA